MNAVKNNGNGGDVARLLEEIAVLQTENNALLGEIGHLTQQCDQLLTAVNRARDEIAGLQARIAELEGGQA